MTGGNDVPEDAADVARRTRRGISWSLLGAVVTNVMRIVSVAVLARLLAPKDFGIVAAAVSVMIVLHQVRDVGVGVALVQRKDLDRGHTGTAFAFSFYLGVVMG